MLSFPGEVLIGVTFGVLIGITIAFVIGIVSFLSRQYGGYAVPDLLVAILIVGLFGVNVYALGIYEADTQVAPRLAFAGLTVVILGLYGHSQGSGLASRLPRETAWPTQRKRRLSGEAVESVDGLGQVTLRSTGTVREIEGYPPLPPATKQALETRSWQLPADLPLDELEHRLEDRLKTTHNLAEVSVSVDARGVTTIAAAPPATGMARRIPEGHRALSLEVLLPAGLAAGDRVTITCGDETIEGIVLGSNQAHQRHESLTNGHDPAPESADRPLDRQHATVGSGHVTVAVDTAAAGTLLSGEVSHLFVQPQGQNDEFGAFATLEASGRTVRQITLTDETRELLANHADDVWLLASRKPDAETEQAGDWTFSQPLLAGRASIDVADESTDSNDDAENKAAWIDSLPSGTELFVLGDEGVVKLLSEHESSTPAVEVVR